MATPINTIYSWFETGDFPTQAQFQASWSSFWHKDEAIPMTNISGLSDQFGKFVLVSTFNAHLNDQNAHPYFAKKDASNLTPTNVNNWKAKLGVGDLPENIATYDYDLHNHVMMKDGTTKEATDLGKNIANSSLTSVTGAGMTLGAPYTWSTANQPFSITGLPDKSADVTFDRIRVQNSLGQEAMVTNAYVLLKNTFGQMTASQSLELGQLLNGGVGSAGNMSVNLISPPIIQKIDSIEYILLRGVNLNLNATSKKIEILDSVTKAVVVTIPDNQIQLNNDGLSLVFYYNFKDFVTGEFVIRLTSGVKVYTTDLTLKTVLKVNNINLDALTYDILYAAGVTPSSGDIAVGRNVAINTPTGATMGGAIPKVSVKSNEIFAQGDDFYIEFTVNLGSKSASSADLNASYIGLGYSYTQNTLTPSSLVHFNYGYSANNDVVINNNNIRIPGTQITPVIETVIIIKTGNLFRTIVRNTNHQVTLSNNSGYSLFLNIVGRANGTMQSVQTQIIKAYKFN